MTLTISRFCRSARSWITTFWALLSFWLRNGIHGLSVGKMRHQAGWMGLQHNFQIALTPFKDVLGPKRVSKTHFWLHWPSAEVPHSPQSSSGMSSYNIITQQMIWKLLLTIMIKKWGPHQYTRRGKIWRMLIKCISGGRTANWLRSGFSSMKKTDLATRTHITSTLRHANRFPMCTHP